MWCQTVPIAFAAIVIVMTMGCSAKVNPASIEDAKTAARAKSALVNDPEIGIHPIEVRVTNGVARLSGRVSSAAEVDRAVALVRAVPGIAAVVSELRVGGEPIVRMEDEGGPAEVGEIERRAAELGGAAERRLLGVGAALGWNGPDADRLDPSASLGPLVRLGSGRGLGLSLGFGWFSTDLRAGAGEGDGEIVGRLRIKPVMGGLGYTIGGDRVSVSLSAVAGVAFNRVSPSERLSGRQVPLDADDSLAWRPGVSVWIDASSRVAVNVSAGYVFTRPELTLLDEGEIVRRRLTADTLLVRVGLLYKLF